ncbi:MAG: hypothetical protein GY749_30395 [Desulfobacteraceae bacterium]|nr:hypothetical protein [Desulfobacteraceae bacterium]
MHPDNNTSASDSGPEFCAGRKITGIHKGVLWELLQETPECPSRILLNLAAETLGPVPVSVRQVNRLRVEWRLSRGKGRPESGGSYESHGEPVRVIPDLGCVGVHIFGDWMDWQEGFSETLVLLKDAAGVYKTDHPEENFPLLSHRDETVLLRFKALFYAPLFGIGKLTEYDVREHPLETLIGRGYQSSTLNQFLGQLERIDAGEALMPALIPADSGNLCYADGHMTAFWTTVSMHKGKITMLGRIMPGSKAIIAHNENGHAIYAEYSPPDIHLNNVVSDYCEHIVSVTGTEIFVIDREINSVSAASAFEGRKLGLLSMLNKNEYKDLSDWETQPEKELEDGSALYSGQWKDEKKREKDPRHFVIAEKDGKLLVYWGTSAVRDFLKPEEWPGVYSQRSEVQENSFRRMIEHGALNVNYGTKKITGPDRHQERAKKKAEEKLAAACGRKEKKEQQISEQEEKVRESEERGHSKRLGQRQESLADMQKELEKTEKKEKELREQTEALGQPGQRADRDFRKQRIMTFRTLLLENALIAFFIALVGNSDTKIGLGTLISLFFRRSGTYTETYSEIIYRISTTGLSLSYKNILKKVADGLNAVNINRQGKPLRLQLGTHKIPIYRF